MASNCRHAAIKARQQNQNQGCKTRQFFFLLFPSCILHKCVTHIFFYSNFHLSCKNRSMGWFYCRRHHSEWAIDDDDGTAIWLANNKWRCSKMDSGNIIYRVHTWIPNAITSKSLSWADESNSKKNWSGVMKQGAQARAKKIWDHVTFEWTARWIDGHRYLFVAFANIDSW